MLEIWLVADLLSFQRDQEVEKEGIQKKYSSYTTRNTPHFEGTKEMIKNGVKWHYISPSFYAIQLCYNVSGKAEWKSEL